MRIEVIQNGRVIPKAQASAVLLDVSRAFRARQDQSRLERRVGRLANVPDRNSVARAILAVEERLVKAFWTIARQPAKNLAPISGGKCGLDYIADRGDLKGYSDAAGGKWEAVAPRPPIPSGKEIDAANEALEWLLLIADEGLRRLLVIGATSKRGDAGRRISWERLRPSLPEYAGFTVRTLQNRYRQALLSIVNELTLARVSPVSHKCT